MPENHAPPTLPTLLLTCGDPAGIGPEVACRAWAETPAHARARLRVVADPAMLAAVLRERPGLPGLALSVVPPDDPRPSRPTELLVVEPRGDVATEVPPATATAAGGRSAARAVETAVDLVLRGVATGIVTGPLHKGALHAAGYDVPGHTELLARACGLDDDAVSMMLWLPDRDGPGGLGVVHATLHESLRSAVARLSTPAITAAGRRLADLLEPLLGKRPRIAVAAVNPHGGEDGLFGDEEARIVAPAVAELRAAGLDVAGPLPADTLFLRASRGEFDGVVAQYHDQGHIPIKLLGMHRAVNITLGLPLVRTSVAHGTAFDIVGTGAADPASMLAAIDAAVRLAAAGWPSRSGGPGNESAAARCGDPRPANTAAFRPAE
jgi:4-hydroxythreonine-4-phosphate dehydrogenase